jgi:hypothetical protein
VYCVVDRLDYIQGMGFDAVWISPIVQNIGATPNSGEAYHGFVFSLPLSNLPFLSDLKADITCVGL